MVPWNKLQSRWHLQSYGGFKISLFTEIILLTRNSCFKKEEINFPKIDWVGVDQLLTLELRVWRMFRHKMGKNLECGGGLDIKWGIRNILEFKNLQLMNTITRKYYTFVLK